MIVNFLLEREQTLYGQLDDLHQNYSMNKNTRLQKLKSDFDRDSAELDRIDPKNWAPTDRQQLTNHWLDLQEKINDQAVDLIYKPTTLPSSSYQPHPLLGEVHLKTTNQDNEHLQIARLQRPLMPLYDPFEHPDGLTRSNQVTLFLVLFYSTGFLSLALF